MNLYGPCGDVFIRVFLMPSLAHKIELKPNNKQKTYFRKAFGVSRFVWNWALASWNKAYEENKKLEKDQRVPMNGLALKKEFNRIKKEDFPWTFEVTKYASQQPFIHLNAAFKRYFKGLSNRPKFKKKNKSPDSFYIGGDQIKVENKKIWVPILGWMRLKESLRFDGKIRSATFSRKAGRWFVSIQVDTDVLSINRRKKAQKDAVGIDVGINSLIYSSDGISVVSPKPLKKNLRALKRASKRLSKKEKTSKGREKEKLRVQKIHHRISNIRKDYLHKISSHFTAHYKNIAIEDLNVSGMLKNHKLSRAISDLGIYELRRQLEYKSKMYGNYLIIADRFFPSSKKCSSCGAVKKDLSLKERTYNCSSGVSLDRDLNASLNLRNLIKIGPARPEFTPREMTALDLWELSLDPTSIDEEGNQQQTCMRKFA